MRPVHPGEVLLEDYIKPMGVSVRALSIALHIPYSHLREIVDGKRGVSADTALRLERYFGSDAQGWLALQAAYDLRITEKKMQKRLPGKSPPGLRHLPESLVVNIACFRAACMAH
jgi:antitoxin HigA-1